MAGFLLVYIFLPLFIWIEVRMKREKGERKWTK